MPGFARDEEEGPLETPGCREVLDPDRTLARTFRAAAQKAVPDSSESASAPYLFRSSVT